MPTFIPLTEPTNIHYRIKLHQNPTSSFQVRGIFSFKNTKIALDVKLPGQMSSESNHFYGLPWHISLKSYINFWLVVFRLLRGQTDRQTCIDTDKHQWKIAPAPCSTAGTRVMEHVQD